MHFDDLNPNHGLQKHALLLYIGLHHGDPSLGLLLLVGEFPDVATSLHKEVIEKDLLWYHLRYFFQEVLSVFGALVHVICFFVVAVSEELNEKRLILSELLIRLSHVDCAIVVHLALAPDQKACFYEPV